MMVDPDLKSTPDGSQPGSNPGYSVDKIFGSTNCTFSRCNFLCLLLRAMERRPAAALFICKGHISP